MVRRVLLRLEMGKMKRCNIDTCRVFGFDKYFCVVERASYKGWLAIAKLKPLSLFISLLSMLKKAFYNVKIAK